MKKLLMLAVAIMMLAGGACRAGDLDIGPTGIGPYTMYSLKDDNPELEPALLLTLASYKWLNGHVGIKGTEFVSSQFDEFDGVLAATADIKKLALELATGGEVPELNPLLKGLQAGLYASKEFNRIQAITEGGIDYGLIGGYRWEW